MNDFINVLKQIDNLVCFESDEYYIVFVLSDLEIRSHDSYCILFKKSNKEMISINIPLLSEFNISLLDCKKILKEEIILSN